MGRREECDMCYVIIKHIETEKATIPVIILDTHGEVLEFDTKDKAEEFRALLEVNSDSGHEFTLRKIHSH
jgi:hypothetical protein